jgi:hypothetical protein
MGFVVTVRVPDNMTNEQVEREIGTSMGFGQAQVGPALFVFTEKDESELHDRPVIHTDMLAHDGYARHNHLRRDDHLGVHRKEWGPNV